MSKSIENSNYLHIITTLFLFLYLTDIKKASRKKSKRFL